VIECMRALDALAVGYAFGMIRFQYEYCEPKSDATPEKVTTVYQ
jgi:hypothetical protein